MDSKFKKNIYNQFPLIKLKKCLKSALKFIYYDSEIFLKPRNLKRNHGLTK